MTNEPTDPDVDLHAAEQRRELPAAPWTVLGAVSIGGALGALARYGLATAYPHRPAGFPWATLTVNVLGCLLIGVLMVLVTDVWPTRRLLRPFFGTGVLGGFTTFSTYAVDVRQLVAAGRLPAALAYLLGTLAAALLAVALGATTTRRLVLTRWLFGRVGR